MKKGDGDKIYEELLKIRLEVSLTTYLTRYLLPVADDGWEFAVREMIDNAKYVLEAETIAFQDKVHFFDVLSVSYICSMNLRSFSSQKRITTRG